MANVVVLLKPEHVGVLQPNANSNRCTSEVKGHENNGYTSTLNQTSVTLPLLMQTPKCPAIVKKSSTSNVDHVISASMPSLNAARRDGLVVPSSAGNTQVWMDNMFGEGYSNKVRRPSNPDSLMLSFGPDILQGNNNTQSHDKSEEEIHKMNAFEDVSDAPSAHSSCVIRLKKNKKKKKHKNRPKTSSYIKTMPNVSTQQHRNIPDCKLSGFSKPLTLSAKATPFNLTKQLEYSTKLKHTHSEGKPRPAKPKNKIPLATTLSFDESLLLANNSYKQNSVSCIAQSGNTGPAIPSEKSKAHFRLIKVYLSEKQSGNLRELGLDFPCAPPATPRSDTSQPCEYVPSLSDIRSQRALKARLENMQKKTKHKQEKEKEEKIKLSKIHIKEKESEVKKRQRQEIYALNKIMTELEHQNFELFCKDHGLNS